MVGAISARRRRRSCQWPWVRFRSGWRSVRHGEPRQTQSLVSIPASGGVGLSTFVCYATWATLRGGRCARYSRLPLPVLFPRTFRRLAAQWFGPRPAAWPSWLPFSPALISCRSRASSGSPAITTAARTTRRSGPIRGLHGRRTADQATGRAPVPADPQNSIATCCSSRWSARDPRLRRVACLLVHRLAFGAESFGIVIGRSSSRRTRFCWRVPVRLSLDGTLSADASINSGAAAGRPRVRLRKLPQSPPYGVGLDQLFAVGFADLYVRLCSMGVWSDVRIL